MAVPDIQLYYFLILIFLTFSISPFRSSHWRCSIKKLFLKETRNSFKKRPFNLGWTSNKTIMEVGNITKAATSKCFLHLSYENAQLLFL